MKIIEALNAPEKPNPHGVSARLVLDTDPAQVVLITLQPGEALKWHITPVDVFFYILEGTGRVEIGDEVETVAPNHCILSPAKIKHRLANPANPGDTDAPFRVLVVKTPKPTSSTRIL